MKLESQDAAIAAAIAAAGLRESAGVGQTPDQIKKVIESKVGGKVVVRQKDESTLTVQRVLNG
jgi:hypothetical protein